jgi:putative Ca2+/H+ antiporter (TMEM165/GDT1 family)
VAVSWLGAALALIYLAFTAVQMGRMIARRSFGGIFSEEFAVFVLTLPASALAELPRKRGEALRVAIYVLAALLNSAALYFLGAGIAWIVRRLSG